MSVSVDRVPFSVWREATDVDVALHGVEKEVGRQVELWGEQSHPFRYDNSTDDANYYTWKAEEWKTRNSHRVEYEGVAWSGVLLEEVFEALAEDDPDKQIEELEQVAAVAVSAILDIRRKRDGNGQV
jgi:hypothetical protein